MSDASRDTTLREHMDLATRFFRNPRTIGAVSASSRALGRQMVAELPKDHPVTVVELGPGTGVITRAIVDRVAEESRILAIELEPVFAERVQARWPSVDCVCGSAVELERFVNERHLSPVDHIISALPFASLTVADTRQIMDGIERTLRPGGTFTTFQYVYSYLVPAARLFRREMSRHLGAEPTRHLVVRNFPAAFILTWTRQAIR